MLGWFSAASILRFALKTGESFCIVREGFRQDLDGDVTPELGVVRLINLSHTARANLCKQFVRAQTAASANRHLPFSRGSFLFQLLKPVQHDIELLGRLPLVVGLEHQKALPIWGYIVVWK